MLDRYERLQAATLVNGQPLASDNGCEELRRLEALGPVKKGRDAEPLIRGVLRKALGMRFWGLREPPRR